MKIQYTLSLLFLISSCFFLTKANEDDIYRTFQQIVVSHGYKLEVYNVTTDDCYILTVFRIPGKNISNQIGIPVLLQHGFLDSSDGWVANDDKSPAFILVDAGYDVWLGNSRGNKYSKKHCTLKPSQYEFWQFSWEEMGMHDIPAMIDFITAKTGYPQVAYVGHSMGNTQLIYAMTRKLSYFQQKLSLYIALAPAVRMNDASSPLLNIVENNFADVLNLFGLVGQQEIFEADWMTTGSMRLLCTNIPQICELGVFLLSDDDLYLINETSFKVYMGHYPSGASLKTLVHFVQLMKAK